MTSSLCFDLERLEITSLSRLERSWLFVDKHVQIPKEKAFLLSLSDQHIQFKNLVNSGQASSLKQAHDFLKAAFDGKCALEILPLLVNHLNDIVNQDATPAFSKERENFIKQFELDIFTQGLNGFLEKRTQRFQLDVKHAQQLQQVLQWLEARL